MSRLRPVLFGRSAERLLGGVALFALVLGPAARVGSATTLSGTVTETGISGFAGTPFTVGDANSTTHAVFGLASEERSDKPCLVVAKKEIVDDSTVQTFPQKDLCGPNGPTSDTIQASFSNTDETGLHVFVTALQVCMNSAKTRVKGFQIRGAEVSDHGTLIELREGGTEPRECGAIQVELDGTEFRTCGDDVTLEPLGKRQNCDEPGGRMAWVECPAGKVATALVVHYAAGTEPRSVTGIALKCKGLAP